MCFYHHVKKIENKKEPILEEGKETMKANTSENTTEITHSVVNEKNVQELIIKKVNLKKDKVTKAKQYIVQKSPNNKRKWEVIIKGGSKALKLFNTEVEASEYAKVTAKNQGASVLKRASKGEKKGKFI